ncbi:MAG TPA: hypothetical protein PK369_03985 [Thermoclostridium sp.]|nr:hypothetical protein [Thermoclostridium sp.]HPU45327.1 hypothetical protein [Thermoclostridium sp.]
MISVNALQYKEQDVFAVHQEVFVPSLFASHIAYCRPDPEDFISFGPEPEVYSIGYIMFND